MISKRIPVSAAVLLFGSLGWSQPPSAPGRGGGPNVVSPQIEADGRVTFRILAPRASNVTITGDLNQGLVAAAPAAPSAVVMAKGADGIWTGTTIRPIKPGAWRYMFNVDGVSTVDSRNVETSPIRDRCRAFFTCLGIFRKQETSRMAPCLAFGMWRPHSVTRGAKCTSTRRQATARTP